MFSSMPRGIRRLLWLRRTRAAIHAEIDEELASLLDARVEALTAQGMSPTGAHAEAIRRLGADLDQVRAQLHRSATLRHRRMRLRDLAGAAMLASWLLSRRAARVDPVEALRAE